MLFSFISWGSKKLYWCIHASELWFYSNISFWCSEILCPGEGALGNIRHLERCARRFCEQCRDWYGWPSELFLPNWVPACPPFFFPIFLCAFQFISTISSWGCQSLKLNVQYKICFSYCFSLHVQNLWLSCAFWYLDFQTMEFNPFPY